MKAASAIHETRTPVRGTVSLAALQHAEHRYVALQQVCASVPAMRILGFYRSVDEFALRADALDGTALPVLLLRTWTMHLMDGFSNAQASSSVGARAARVAELHGAWRRYKEVDEVDDVRARLRASVERGSQVSRAGACDMVREARITVYDYDWPALEGMLPAPTSAAASRALPLFAGRGAGEGACAPLAGQDFAIVAAQQHDKREPVYIFLRAFSATQEHELDVYMANVRDAVAPMVVLAVPMYVWGPASGFDSAVTQQDRDYEESSRAAGRSVMLAPNMDVLRERIRLEYGVDPDSDAVTYLKPEAQTADADGNVAIRAASNAFTAVTCVVTAFDELDGVLTARADTEQRFELTPQQYAEKMPQYLQSTRS